MTLCSSPMYSANNKLLDAFLCLAGQAPRRCKGGSCGAVSGEASLDHFQTQFRKKAGLLIIDGRNVHMDLTERNLETIASLRLHNMTVEELAEADRRAGLRLHFSDGVWWREVKPFFSCRPIL